MRATALLATVALFLPGPGGAQIYKCATDGGAPAYQDTPCPAGREVRNLASDPATVSVVPFAPPVGATTRLTAPAVPRPRVGAGERKASARAGNPAERRYLHPGMHEGEVLARAGPPDMKSGGSGHKLARWTYMPSAGDPQTLTTVVLEYGKVVEVERKVVR